MTPAPETKPLPLQLLAYSFPPGAEFEGRLMGALQRVESGGAMRVLEALFVGREADSGELAAVSFAHGSSAGMIGRLIDFRLAGSARAEQTEAALAGARGELVRSLAAVLEPGWAIAGVLVEHSWAGVLDEAVARIGGTELADDLLDDARAEDAWNELPSELAASQAPPT